MVNRLLEKSKVPLTFTAAVAIIIQLYIAFYYAPTEKYMGDIQRIMYFHVPSAFVAFVAFALVFVGGVLYLYTKNKQWDYLALSAAEIGVIFTSFVLVTGALWAKPVWNAWWVWEDPRLVTSLILWFMYIAYLFIRASVKGEDRLRKFASVFGIIAFLDVPIVYFSVKWWRTIHPKVIDEQGVHMPVEMAQTLFFSIISFQLLFFMLLIYRFFLERQKEKIKELKNREIIDRRI
ncbi:cytochrome c biogenesis protein [Cytobacillus firmus]|uniref:Heme exporter protein C n=1 Tax=Cytobacillus firmus TaxID=1399 RepID=A0AA46P5G9_CYTFI|nr:cytochrome c biogenesis protein [Cytobacillus firmus]UYG98087.1 cytochrome c biogenesis protein [Cytobacillus firmus]